MASRISTGASNTYNFKIVLLGEGCVGKTSCVLRYVEDAFNDKHLTTLQASFLNKKLNIRGKRVNLNIWDTAGQERFHALGPIYYRDADGAVLVYDITDTDSFGKVKKWVKELRKMLGAENISLVIAGNKTDLEKQRQVDADTAREYAQSVDASHFDTSAKLNRGIEEMFLELSQKMILRADEKSRSQGSNSPNTFLGTGSGRGNTVTIVDDSEVEPRKKSGCCGGSKNNNDGGGEAAFVAADEMN